MSVISPWHNAATVEARQRGGSPCLLIAKRYRDRDDSLAQLEAAAEWLIVERLLLQEDRELVVRLAGSRFDVVG